MSEHEKIFPAPDVLNEVEYGKFILTNLAAKRAKQIKDGAPPLVRIDTGHPLSIALAEIAAGKIKPILGADAQAAELDDDFTAMDDLAIDDLGMLLPGGDDDSGDESEAFALLDLDGPEEAEESDEAEDLDDVLAADDTDAIAEDDEAVPDTGDISLDDLAEEENASSDDDEESDRV